MIDHALLAKNFNVEFDRQLSLGERLSDRIAEFAGSWIFIISFIGVMVLWIVINTFVIVTKPFDPYPYILLNLASRRLLQSKLPSLL